MKLRDICYAVAVSGAALSAGVHAQKPAAASPLKELTWISSHFETSTEVTRVLDMANCNSGLWRKIMVIHEPSKGAAPEQ